MWENDKLGDRHKANNQRPTHSFTHQSTTSRLASKLETQRFTEKYKYKQLSCFPVGAFPHRGNYKFLL